MIEGKEDELRALLASMNGAPGVVDPDNELVPFGRFERLHVARFVVLEAPTADDITVYGMAPEPWPPSLVFLGDIDGPADSFLHDLVARAGPGLRRIFSHCQDFSPNVDLLAWMKRHERRSAANYVNWIGRTVRQVREEQALRAALLEQLHNGAADGAGRAAGRRARPAGRFVDTERQAGRIELTPPAPTPADWRAAQHAACHRRADRASGDGAVSADRLAGAACSCCAGARRPIPTSAPHPGEDHIRRIAELEDQEIANQFTVFGDLKPGLFRRWLTVFLLWLLNYSARHIYNRG